MKIYIGIDNGVSGSLAFLAPPECATVFRTPCLKVKDYQKGAKRISRIHFSALRGMIFEELTKASAPDASHGFVLLERPMVNPLKFKASVSALRAHEATLIVLESLGIAYDYIDSRAWQKMFLPGVKGEALKPASLDVARRLFPKTDFGKLKDGDALLIAEYARRKNM